MTARISKEWQIPIEEVADWPWQKRWLYFDSLQALNIREQAAMPDTEIDTADIQNGNIDPSQFSHGNMPAGGMSRGFNTGTTKDVPPSVGRHEHVVKSQSH